MSCSTASANFPLHPYTLRYLLGFSFSQAVTHYLNKPAYGGGPAAESGDLALCARHARHRHLSPALCGIGGEGSRLAAHSGSGSRQAD